MNKKILLKNGSSQRFCLSHSNHKFMSTGPQSFQTGKLSMVISSAFTTAGNLRAMGLAQEFHRLVAYEPPGYPPVAAFCSRNILEPLYFISSFPSNFESFTVLFSVVRSRSTPKLSTWTTRPRVGLEVVICVPYTGFYSIASSWTLEMTFVCPHAAEVSYGLILSCGRLDVSK